MASKTVADVMKMVKENEVKFVDFRFTDTRGKEQHVSVPVSHFDEDKFTSGHAFDGSSIARYSTTAASISRTIAGPNARKCSPRIRSSPSFCGRSGASIRTSGSRVIGTGTIRPSCCHPERSEEICS